MDNSVITGHEIIGAETKTIPTRFNEKNSLQNTKLLYFNFIFINHYSIIDSYKYLLLSDKISSKTKTLVTISRQK